MRATGKQITCSRLLRSALNIEFSSSPSSTAAASHFPLYLCPAAARASSTLPRCRPRRAAAPLSKPGCRLPLLPLCQSCRSHAEAVEPHGEQETPSSSSSSSSSSAAAAAAEPVPVRNLPVQCHGCGALSQTAVPNEPGYYDLNRKAVRVFLGLLREERRDRPEDEIVRASLRSLSRDKLHEIGVDPDLFRPENTTDKEGQDAADAAAEPHAPLCDRCHSLVHNNTGDPIYHPTMEAIRDTIEESPYKYNHVYHVLDAADFPMSLLPRVHQLLDLMPLRSKNRRQRGGKFYRGKRTEMSFIITRSDLLAPKKEAVDRMMPYLIETLREALPRDSRHVRLGNVRCVSAKRGWWTKELKEDIWKRGGAGWMVGKANVGKSQLFHAVFPKGRMGWAESKHDISVALQARDQFPPGHDEDPDPVLPGMHSLEEDSLLPPPQPETNYPQMPVVSALPGTTASPIRVPFGGGKGELIDLPGLERSSLETFVREEHRPSLIMKARMTPEQQVMKPGQSLLIGGFIRITPRTPDLVFLAYAFTPIEPHLTTTKKAIEIQNQEGQVKVGNIGVPGMGERTRHAGSFEVRYDVTKKRAGPITNKHAAGIKVDRLPYRVLSLDLLIEGCGWVEITVQVRTRDLFKPKPGGAHSISVGGVQILQSLDLSDPDAEDKVGGGYSQDSEEPNWPVVDVYSPEGRFIGSRPPMNAWMYNKVRKTPQTSKKRPRKSMTGAKKRDKEASRRKAQQ